MPSITDQINQSLDNRFGQRDYSNPVFTYLQQYLPHSVKDLLHWCEYIYGNVPEIASAIQKFIEYPVTDFVYNVEKGTNRAGKLKELLEDKIDLKSEIICAGIDYHVYGNSFVSLFFPFDRYLVCPGCNGKFNIDKVDYKIQDLKFQSKCPSCKKTGFMGVSDRKSLNKDRISVIRWSPRDMDISYNPITKEAEYVYNIPKEVRQRVMRGDKIFINSTPIELLRAIYKNKSFKFKKGKIFHLRRPAPSGFPKNWGYPIIGHIIQRYFHYAVLHKANEAIAMEHIVPFRVFHPQSSTATDPISSMSMSKWKNHLEANYTRWRKDPNRIMVSPIPLGVQDIGGQGRAMMVNPELQDTIKSIVAGMGIPLEFVYGGMTYSGSSVALRMLEVQMHGYVYQLQRLMHWIIKSVTNYLDMEYIRVDLVPFRSLDDPNTKSLLMNYAVQNPNRVSDDTVLKLLGINAEDEKSKVRDEKIAQAKFDKEMEIEISKVQDDLMGQQSKGGDLSYNQQAIISEADNLVAQMQGMPQEQRRSFLANLQQEDIVMYSVVSVRQNAIRHQRNQGLPQQ